jgi:hypothetical protein
LAQSRQINVSAAFWLSFMPADISVCGVTTDIDWNMKNNTPTRIRADAKPSMV